MFISSLRNLFRRGSKLFTPEHRRTRRPRSFYPRLDVLEDRLALSIFRVINNLDLDNLGRTVPGSLRAAIDGIDGIGGSNREFTAPFVPGPLGDANGIVFDIGPPNVFAPVISLKSLPTITTNPVVILGFTQPGAILPDATGAFTPGIELSAGGDGLTIAVPGCIVQGLNVDGNGNGIVLKSGHNLVDFNILQNNGGAGVLITGTGAAANEVFDNVMGLKGFASNVLRGNLTGVTIQGGASGNLIDFNVIGANTYGVELLDSGTMGNLIQDNWIGCHFLDPNNSFETTIPLGNTSYGVYISSGAGGNIIGGTTPDEAIFGNLISANLKAGVLIDGGAANVIGYNYIGTNGAGDAAFNTPPGPALPLGNGIGVEIAGSATATHVVNNLISGNFLDGVQLLNFTTGNVVQHNLIGTNAAGTSTRDSANGYLGNGQFGVHLLLLAFGNTVTGNVISGNGNFPANDGAGVSINDDGTTGNMIESNWIGTNAYGTDFATALHLGNAGNGVAVVGASGNTVSGNVIAFNGSHGVDVDTGRGNIIKQNQILVNSIDGVLVLSATGTLVGANVISGNHAYGVELTRGAFETLVTGNLIGTNLAGTAAWGNGLDGVHIQNSSGNTVSANTISGNRANGIIIDGDGTETGNLILGNHIGTSASGLGPVPNGGDGVGLFGQGVSGNTITGNFINFNQAHGVEVSAARNNTVSMNQILANGFDGVSFERGASGNIVGGAAAGNTISGNGYYGVELRDGASANQVTSNFIGTDVTGKLALGNSLDGVYIWSGPAQDSVAAVNNVIYANVISANRNGIIVTTSGNLIQGNVIGTDDSGKAPLPNAGDGVGLFGAGASSNTITKNIINFNKAHGVQVNAGQGNTVSGSAIESNGLDGVLLEKGASHNTVGGTAAGAGNIIISNGLDGVQVDASSFDSILGNAISSNGRLGIDLSHNGNDNLQAPVLTSAVADATTTTLSAGAGGPVGTFTVEVFLCDSSSPGQGETFLIAQTVTTNADGTFTITLPFRLAPGTKIVLTVTDPNGDTSEFSAGILVS